MLLASPVACSWVGRSVRRGRFVDRSGDGAWIRSRLPVELRSRSLEREQDQRRKDQQSKHNDDELRPVPEAQGTPVDLIRVEVRTAIKGHAQSGCRQHPGEQPGTKQDCGTEANKQGSAVASFRGRPGHDLSIDG
jgi:hypothetical protein